MHLNEQLLSVVQQQPYPLLFATLSGAHLYGFPSPDSDYDVRGVHVLPAPEVLGLETPRETIESLGLRDGIELDLVTHDARKFFELLLKRNGYVLEQLYSPLVVYATPEHEELKRIARGCITRYHAYHYLGFAGGEWRELEKQQPFRAKRLLYVYRVLLTGIHLMRSGEIEANLLRLNEMFKLPQIDDLIAMKLAGSEHTVLQEANIEFHRAEYTRLRAELEQSARASALPATPSAKPALSELLVRLRLAEHSRQGAASGEPDP